MELSLVEARACVIGQVSARATRIDSERVPLLEAGGRRLAQDARADRDYPPFARSMRDGFAVVAVDCGAIHSGGTVRLRSIGLIRAGEQSAIQVSRGTCVEIMTGAAVPMGADAVVMVEHTQRDGDMIGIQRAPEPGENIAPRGSDAHAGTVVLRQGARIDYSAIAVLASIGCTQPPVARRPRVAVLSTGDEVVDASATPGDVQIRNSNSYALAALAERAGAEVIQLPIAPDEPERLNQLLTQGLSCGDVLLVSGGVSAGKFDLVEPVLGRLGAQFLFDAVRIRPGRPAVFGIADNHFVFGLPGNPLGTIVTFELLVRPALELLCGADPSYLGRPYICGELGFSYHGKALPLTQFVPVRLSGDFARARVEKLPYHGSADLPALAAADGWLVVPEYRTELHQSAVVDVLLK